MSFLHKQIAPPSSWDVFEKLCHALYRREWRDSAAQRNGRQGQPQAGVDVYGTVHANGLPGQLWGVQCKQKSLGKKVTKKEFDAELAKAELFQPTLAHWILATTCENDATLQEHVRKINAKRQQQGLFAVSICSWEDMCSLLVAHRDVAKEFYPEQFTPIQTSTLYLPSLPLSSHFNDPRNDLEKLRAQLQASGSSAVLAGAKAALHGMGGVGKTQLALQYCQRFQNDYAGVWWLQAETMDGLAQDCVLFCSKQGLQLAPGEAPFPVMNAWLAQQSNWLLVYDNAEDAQALQAVLPNTANDHHILITSRQPVWQGMQTIALDVWQDAEALPFLQQRLPASSEADLLALTMALGGLPLALEQACAYLHQTDISIARYLQRIQEPLRAWELLDKTASQLCSRSVFVTLTLAFDKLSPAAKDVLGICAWLAAEPIPEYLFTEESEDFPDKLPPSLRSIAADEFAWRETLAELHKYALCHSETSISADHVGNRKQTIASLHLHRLSQAAMRTKCVELGGTALLLVRAVFPQKAHFPEHWPRCRKLQAHVYHLQQVYQASWQQGLHLACLLGRLAFYLKFGPGLYQQALALERASLAICQEDLGEEHSDTLSTMHNLAMSLRQLGDAAAARSLQEQVLAISRRVLGEEHPDTLVTMNNLATSLKQLDDAAAARTLEEQVLAIRIRVLGEEHPSTLTTMNNLAASLWQLGDAAAARPLQEQVLAILIRVLGEEHPDTLSAMNNLASSLKQLGDAAAARSLEEQVLAIRIRVLGEEHPDTLITINNLAVSLYQLGDYLTAQTLMEQALHARTRVLGEEHPNTQDSKQSLATIIAAQARTRGKTP